MLGLCYTVCVCVCEWYVLVYQVLFCRKICTAQELSIIIINNVSGFTKEIIQDKQQHRKRSMVQMFGLNMWNMFRYQVHLFTCYNYLLQLSHGNVKSPPPALCLVIL